MSNQPTTFNRNTPRTQSSAKRLTLEQQREAWFVRHVDSQPPLTQKQRDRLDAILGRGAFRATSGSARRAA